MSKAPAVKWTREHLLIALNLYCKLPFGKLHHRNPMIVEVAKKMGRSANSLAMKLSNLASLDPVLEARGIKGLAGASAQDRRGWAEFHSHMETLGPESEQLLHDLFTQDDAREVDLLSHDKVELEPSTAISRPTGPTMVLAVRRERRGQQFFRQTVLTTYGVSCCVTGINVPRLLVASHIKPWRSCSDAERIDPRNGLCLSSLHDAAFDDGLITLDKKLAVVLSTRLTSFFPHPVLEQNFAPFKGARIRLPQKVAEPSPDFLEYHRDVVFQK